MPEIGEIAMAAVYTRRRSGPLAGLRVVEFAGIGPAPFACMLLADMGADVVRVERPGTLRASLDVTLRGRRCVELDLKSPEDRARAMDLAAHADLVVEGFRPGVMERLSLGPENVAARNPKAVYGRITGWGQDGPLSQSAGHDINYIAISGALEAIGPGDRPSPPLNLVGDYGGGALYLVVGVLAALHEASQSGRGQVVDAAMSDGAASMMTLFHVLAAKGEWRGERANNLLDGGAPYYRAYRCADGKHVAVGALEPQFYRELCRLVGRHADDVETRHDRSTWQTLGDEFAAIFAARTSVEWQALVEGTDACVAPVLRFDEAPYHPHNRARSTFIEIDGVTQPAPAPRFSRTPSRVVSSPPEGASDLSAVLGEWSQNPAWR